MGRNPIGKTAMTAAERQRAVAPGCGQGVATTRCGPHGWLATRKAALGSFAS
jgi:hypothetical protein